jgi:hypothetical protein
MQAQLHVALYLNFFKHIFKFLKICKKILDVANDEIYGRAKSQCEILYILGYTKIIDMLIWV